MIMGMVRVRVREYMRMRMGMRVCVSIRGVRVITGQGLSVSMCILVDKIAPHRVGSDVFVSTRAPIL